VLESLDRVAVRVDTVSSRRTASSPRIVE